MVQIIKMTYQEKYNMYMKIKKSELVKMLIESNKYLDNIPLRIYFDSTSDVTLPEIDMSICNTIHGVPTTITLSNTGLFTDNFRTYPLSVKI